MAGSAFVATPGWAATLAKSEATFKLDNFSHNPIGVRTFTDTFTDTVASSGNVTASANANASFIVDPLNLPTFAENSSLSTANGAGKSYFGFAQSIAGIIGYDFLVSNKETFSFDFLANLKLETSIDTPQIESASSDGEISFQLYNTTDTNNWIPLDFFTLSGKLKTPGTGDFLTLNHSGSLTVNPKTTSFETSFGGKTEVATAKVDGSYKRTFGSLTYLTLVEVKTNKAVVKTPESSTTLALLLFCLIGVGYGRNQVSKSGSRAKAQQL
ncbi:MAG: PEP-CTERM sorting domain-containing protein [Cyanobacteriota bacterium]